jgi:hypothetical protein
LSYLILGLLSIAMLLAVMALVQERRIRRGLQQILRSLVERMKHYETKPTARGGARDDDDRSSRVR